MFLFLKKEIGQVNFQNKCSQSDRSEIITEVRFLLPSGILAIVCIKYL